MGSRTKRRPLLIRRGRSPEEASASVARRRKKKAINRLLEDRTIEQVSYDQYRETVRHVYDGPQ